MLFQVSNEQRTVTYYHHGERTVASLPRKILDCEGGLVEIGSETPCMIAGLSTYPQIEGNSVQFSWK